MTTIDSAAAYGVRKKTLFAACIAVLSVTLGGCESGSSFFSSSGSDQAALTPPAPAIPPAAVVAKISVAPVFGPSETVAKSLHAQMISAIERQKITVAKTTTDKSEYTLRGYIISSKEKANTRFSYVWDVTDPTGKRLNRIAGEESAPSAQGRDPWAAVTPQIGEKIASKTAANLASWLPSVPSASPAVGPPAPGGSGAAPSGEAIPMAAAPSGAIAPPTTTAALPAAPAPAATGSIGRDGAFAAIVPTVVGAPGGGGVELTNAIQRELQKGGVSLAPGSGLAYRIEGKVTVGPVASGKQQIEIEWQVVDPKGAKLPSIWQKNSVAAGSLDGPWGRTADLVAEAAAKRIIDELRSTQQKQAKAG